MITTMTLSPGVTLRCYTDSRFIQSALSIQLIRPMCRQEAAKNALLPAVLLRGTRQYPDLQAITCKLDDLYGASTGALVRRIGDYQAVGLRCGFVEDRCVLSQDRVLEPMLEFACQLLKDPVLEQGCFCPGIVESEKHNQITAIESRRNDKRAYAALCLNELMCPEDSFGVPRLGTEEQVRAITPEGLYDHYQNILSSSKTELFYVGSAAPEKVAQILTPFTQELSGKLQPLPPQTPFRDAPKKNVTQQLKAAQSRICMGFVTPITIRHPDFAAMQVLNAILGGSMTSKLFKNIREKESLCYDISSDYYSNKGIVTVGAGIDLKQHQKVRQLTLQQLDACRRGDITEEELEDAKKAFSSSLLCVHDSPGAIESYYSATAINGLSLPVEEYRSRIQAVTCQQVQQAAENLQLHSEFFLEGVRE